MKKSALIAIDGSYMEYHSIFRALRLWEKKNRLESKMYLTPREDGTQSNLINSETFRAELYNSFLHTCYVIPEIIESNFTYYRGFDIKGYATIVFCADDFTSRGFRRTIYEGYKGGRTEARAKNPYSITKIKQYFKVIFDQTDIWNRCGYKYAFVDGAEADDIIFKLMTNYNDEYENKIVISSDKDLLQIPDTTQFDLNDKIVTRAGKSGMLTAKEFLVRKVLIGDASDNIPQVFKRVGPAKAEKMIKEGSLKERLDQDENAKNQFELNLKLMDISRMPKELSNKIDLKLSEIMKDETNDVMTLDDQISNMIGEPMML
jgi:5'-3' exonuclease